MTGVAIRPARIEEATALHDIAIRSKRAWGYDDTFMRLAVPALAIAPETIMAGRMLVATADGLPVAIGGLDPTDEAGTLEVSHLFVDPGSMRRGTGRRLFAALLDLARALGAERLRILSDPHAAGFYEAMGCSQVGDAPSDAIPGRRLPLLALDLKTSAAP